MIEPERAVALVEDDVQVALMPALPAARAGHGFRIHDGFDWIHATPIGNFGADGAATAVAVPWQWTGVHRNELLGLLPLPGEDREVTVAGLSIVQEVEASEEAPDGLLVHRFVDWLATLNELGARPYLRPVVDLGSRVGFLGTGGSYQ